MHSQCIFLNFPFYWADVYSFNFMYHQPSITSSRPPLVTTGAEDWTNPTHPRAKSHPCQGSVKSPLLRIYLYTTSVFFPTTGNNANAAYMFSWVCMQLCKKYCCWSIYFKTLYKCTYSWSHAVTFLTYQAFKACLCYDTYVKFIASKCDVVLRDVQPRHFSPYSPTWRASWCLHNLLLVPLRSRLPHRAAGTESDGAQPVDRLKRLRPSTFPPALQEGSYYPKSAPNFILPFYLCHSRGCQLVSHRFKIHLSLWILTSLDSSWHTY